MIRQKLYSIGPDELIAKTAYHHQTVDTALCDTLFAKRAMIRFKGWVVLDRRNGREFGKYLFLP